MTDWMMAIGYFAAFVASFAALVWWGEKQRKRRTPFKRETKVLRLPGESLQRKIQEIDEKNDLRLCGAVVVPLLVAGVGVEISRRCSGWWILVALSLTALAFAIAVAKSAKWLARHAFVRSNYRLGWYGERVIGDALAPLERDSWRVFHDFPREVKKSSFNIDHIAIGPGGVFVIETKTPRKGEARPGKEDHVVEYDGTVLSWPWAENRLGLDQATANAEWFQLWLKSLTGRDYPVRPVLAIPDWMVKAPRRGPLLVVSSGMICHILNEQPTVLDRDDVEQIARLVANVCRDVEY